MTLKDEIRFDLEQHPLDRNPATMALALERIEVLERALEEALGWNWLDDDSDAACPRWPRQTLLADNDLAKPPGAALCDRSA